MIDHPDLCGASLVRIGDDAALVLFASRVALDKLSREVAAPWDRDKDSFRTVSRLEIVATGRRRRFTDEAKLRIVEEGFSGEPPGVGDGAEARCLPLATVSLAAVVAGRPPWRGSG